MKFQFRHAATAWLGVAVTSMAFMGVFAFMIVLSRAPGFNLLFTEQDFFRTALVTHVVLSVVIWFQSYILFLIYYVTVDKPAGGVHNVFALGALAGVALIIATPFTGPAFPMLNNYVPVLNRPLYLAGLGVFFGFAALGVLARVPSLLKSLGARGGSPVVIGGSLAGAGASLVVGVSLMVFAFAKLSGSGAADITPTVYFELLFWGGGHVLQFANTLGMMTVWALLARRITGEDALIGDKTALGVFVFMMIFVMIAPFDYLIEPIESMTSRQFFTTLKGWGVALGPIALGLAVVNKRRLMTGDDLARRGLLFSMALFAMGGLIALTIQGSDTRIPAHYHGTIGGVTICYMTLAMLAMRDNGWFSAGPEWIKRQVTAYGVGQALFVTGMFIGGLLGLARKTYGQAQVLDTFEKIFSMGLMGVGGFLAIVAGGIFVVLMLMSLFRGERPPAA